MLQRATKKNLISDPWWLCPANVLFLFYYPSIVPHFRVMPMRSSRTGQPIQLWTECKCSQSIAYFSNAARFPTFNEGKAHIK